MHAGDMIKDLARELEDARSENKALRDEIAKLTRKKDRATDIISDLKRELADANAKIAICDRDAARFKGHADDAYHELHETENRLIAIASELLSQGKDIIELMEYVKNKKRIRPGRIWEVTYG